MIPHLDTLCFVGDTEVCKKKGTYIPVGKQPHQKYRVVQRRCRFALRRCQHSVPEAILWGKGTREDQEPSPAPTTNKQTNETSPLFVGRRDRFPPQQATRQRHENRKGGGSQQSLLFRPRRRPAIPSTPDSCTRHVSHNGPSFTARNPHHIFSRCTATGPRPPQSTTQRPAPAVFLAVRLRGQQTRSLPVHTARWYGHQWNPLPDDATSAR